MEGGPGEAVAAAHAEERSPHAPGLEGDPVGSLASSTALTMALVDQSLQHPAIGIVQRLGLRGTPRDGHARP